MSRGSRLAIGLVAQGTQASGGDVQRSTLTATGASGTSMPTPGGMPMSNLPIRASAPAGITDPLIASRYAEAVDLNPASFTTNSTSGWFSIKVDRPTILWPTSSVVSTHSASTVTVASGGTGYTLSDVLTVAGNGTSATFTVTGVSAGAVTSVSVTTAGGFILKPANPVSTTGGTGSGCTLNITAYVVGPTVTFNSGSARVIYYAPNRNPSNSNDAQRSKGAGVVYLANPGTWNLRADSDASYETCQINYLLIDAQDPAVAARYLSESGTHRIRTNTGASVSTTSTSLVGENRNRTGLVITSTSGPGNSPALPLKIRLGFGGAADKNGGIEIGTSTTASFAMFGETCWKGSVEAIWASTNASSTGTAYVTITEWE